MQGTITVKNIAPVRIGSWLIVYVHECDCGCKKSRHNFIVNQANKPTDNKVKQLADAHYNNN